MTPQEMVAAAIDAAEEGLAAGELPIGAVVVMGDEIVARTFTRDKGAGRRLAHADLLALMQVDERFGWRRRPYPLRMAINLEPCVMCLGAAMSMGVSEICYALESPSDGAAGIARAWSPASADLPGYSAPEIRSGILRRDSRELFRRYCADAAESGFRTWALSLAELPD